MMTQSKFKKAEKKKSKLRLGISGPSGSGKTYSALRLAKGLGGKIAVIDTENGSASLYADKFKFDVLELAPPFHTSKFIDAINSAVSENYDVIIVDSISHQWAGEGGLLREKEKLDQNPKSNSFANWAKMTPIHDKFINAIIQCNAHLIVTMRSKEEYIQQRENDKTKIVRVGMSPIQRDGIIYELTTVFDIGINHETEVTKDRTGIFVDRTFVITEEVGFQIKEWLESGADIKPNDSTTRPIETLNPNVITWEELVDATTPEGCEHIVYPKNSLPKQITNHAPQSAEEAKAKTEAIKKQEPITFKNFTMSKSSPEDMIGKRFDQIEFAALYDYVNAIRFKNMDSLTPAHKWFFGLYNDFCDHIGSDMYKMKY